MPFYLLLIGSPTEIPFEFQYQLDVQYAVGRLFFRTAEEYERYALSAVAAETDQTGHDRRVTFFGVQTPGDPVTKLMSEQLVAPLARRMVREHPAWKVETILGDAATKQALEGLMAGPRSPSLLFTACHGLGFPAGHCRQRDHQGALVCADWPGRVEAGGPPQREHFFSGRDLSDVASPGLMTFHFSCYSAGTPCWDEFIDRTGSQRRRLAPQDFVALLPQRLLTQGALAVIGHVERAWDWSFRWIDTGPQRQTFESVVSHLLSGHPAGSALEFLDERHAELSVALDDALRRMRRGESTELEVASLFAARNDARNYVLLGDPAVRLRDVEAEW